MYHYSSWELKKEEQEEQITMPRCESQPKTNESISLALCVDNGYKATTGHGRPMAKGIKSNIRLLYPPAKSETERSKTEVLAGCSWETLLVGIMVRTAWCTSRQATSKVPERKVGIVLAQI